MRGTQSVSDCDGYSQSAAVKAILSFNDCEGYGELVRDCEKYTATVRGYSQSATVRGILSFSDCEGYTVMETQA